jgi:hypothetical protein
MLMLCDADSKSDVYFNSKSCEQDETNSSGSIDRIKQDRQETFAWV